jgi:hypothetical protein
MLKLSNSFIICSLNHDENNGLIVSLAYHYNHYASRQVSQSNGIMIFHLQCLNLKEKSNNMLFVLQGHMDCRLLLRHVKLSTH